MSIGNLAQLAPSIQLLLELSDDRLILGHRLSQWCGHGPMLEEDIALSNIALDLIGHAANGLEIVANAGSDVGAGANSETADSLAFLRDGKDFRNIHLVELPNGDFAFTMLRQFLFDSYNVELLKILMDANNHGSEILAGWAAKCHKEDLYHLRHSSNWVLRLGDGTAVSHNFMQEALNLLWRYTAELKLPSEALLGTLGSNAIKLESAKTTWQKLVTETLTQATLMIPKDRQAFANGGRRGLHTEHLSHLLSTMQVLPRAFPGAQW